ncbi:MAG: protein TolR [Thermohalobaculum sp.]|nr:protein TolR [Thermohalobaculum sp.]
MGAAMQKSGRMGRRGRARSAPMSEINVTPFVDVMLVLLIIFMVAAPLLTVGVPLDLPKTQAQSLPSENEPPLTVNLDAEGRVYIQKEEVPPEELVVRLAAIQAERTSDKIYLRADRSLDYGRVMQVMGALSAGGFARVALVTDQAKRGDR